MAESLADRSFGQDGNLFEVADLDGLGLAELARVGFEDAGDDAQQRRLTGAVDAYHADAVAAGNGEVEVLNNRPLEPLEGDFLKV